MTEQKPSFYFQYKKGLLKLEEQVDSLIDD